MKLKKRVDKERKREKGPIYTPETNNNTLPLVEIIPESTVIIGSVKIRK